MRFIWSWGLIDNWGIVMNRRLVLGRRMVLAVCWMVAGCLNRLEGSDGWGEIIRTKGISQCIHRIPSV